MDYIEFLQTKRHSIKGDGFAPTFYPNIAFDFQKEIIERTLLKGRAGMFVDTGLGKTLMQLTIAENIVRKTNKRVLILTPLAVGFQFVQESKKYGIDDVYQSLKGELNGKIILCNYERLHFLNTNDFVAVLLDESSILKNFDGKIKSQINQFIRKTKYRFLSSATPAPNDYIEFGTSSEALGYLSYMDMLERFFSNKEANFKPQDIGTKWYLKPHAENDFFIWVNQWSMTVKKPSDIGFKDDNYALPNLIENNHFVKNMKNWEINNQLTLTNGIARTMSEVRVEQQQTTKERCEKAVELAKGKTSVYWCHFNKEGDLLSELDKEAVQISGSMSLEKKEDILNNFADGKIKRLITKPKITSFGLNWQHCNHSVYFPTWSYEQYYQSVRRFWRFGQKNEVVIDRVLSDGQKRVLDTLNFKTKKAIEFNNKIRENLANTKTYDFKREFNKQIIKPNFIG